MNVFIKWVIRKVITSFAGYELDSFTDGNYIEGTDTVDPVYVHRMVVRYKVVQTGLEDDLFENVLHFVNKAGELPGGPTDDTARTAVQNAFITFWNAIKAGAGSDVKLSEFRWYRLQLGETSTGPPTMKTVIADNPGSGGTQGPHQISRTITFRTTLRRHWGRIYLPLTSWGGGNVLDTSAHTDTLAAAARTFLNSAVTANLVPVVYSPTRQAALSIAELEVDDVPDVTRRRRPRHGLYKKIYTS